MTCDITNSNVVQSHYFPIDTLICFCFSECVDCVVAWGGWDVCRDGERTRPQIITVQPVGAGAACPELLVEIEGTLFTFFANYA